MKALTWHGKSDMRCESVPDPRIEDPRDAIIKVTACAICGSDLHIYNGVIPEMEHGDILGHETMGEVVEVGSENKKLKVGDRVVVPFTISCGECFFCKRGFYSGCERSNPDKAKASKLWRHSPAGLFGYSHLLGGYAGGQAEYLRVPFADVGPMKMPNGLSDEQALFLSDIFPTGYMAADFCNIQPDDTIAVWGCGPVGQFAILSAFMLGAARVIAIDTVPERLALAAAVATSARFRLSASTGASSTAFRWGPPSTGASLSAWPRRRCSTTCPSCWSALNAATSISHSSSRIGRVSRKAPNSTGHSETVRTAA